MSFKSLLSRKTAPAMLLAGLVITAFYFLIGAEAGGINPDAGRISIITRYYGVTAEEIEKTITIPMEEAVSGLPGIKELKSGSEFSLSRISLKISPFADPDSLMIELRENVDRSYAYISQRNPAVQKPRIVDSGSEQRAIFIAAFSGRNMSTEALRPLVENEIKPSFAGIPGLGEIEVSGGTLPEIHVDVDPDRAAAFGYSSDSAAALITGANIYGIAGTIDNGLRSYPVSIEARINSIEALRNLPIGPGLRLNDIAAVGFSFREADNISRLDNTERVSLHIKSSSNNLISISRLLRDEAEKWKKLGYKTEIVYDRGRELEQSFYRIAAALGIGMLISGMLLFLFRVNHYRVIILLFLQPLILLLSLGLLSAAGYQADNWLLAGLTVGTGMILDSALIVTGAVGSRTGKLKEIVSPLVSSTLSTITALIPVISITAEIPGLKQLIAALAAMLSISLVIAVIFIPPFYSPGSRRPSGRWFIFLIKMRKKILMSGRRIISAGLHSRRLFLLSAAALPAAAVICLFSMPVRINRPAESPVIFARLELREGESIESSDKKIKALCSTVGEQQYILSVQSVSRRGGGDLSVRFDNNSTGRDDVISMLKSEGNAIPGGFLYIPEDDRSDNLKLTVSVTGPDIRELKKVSRKALERILQNNWALEGVLHFREDPPAYHYIPDREALAEAGFRVSDAATFLRWNLQGPVADKWYFSGYERDLRVMAAGSDKITATMLGSLKIPCRDSGSFSRLDQLGYFVETTDSSRINRLNSQHSESFTVTCLKRDPVKINRMIRHELDQLDLMEGYSFIPSSELIEKQRLYRSMWSRFFLAVVLILFLLAVERESLKQALLVMLQLPLILSVPIIIMRLSGTELGTEIILGLILVSGMGINNGILIIDKISLGIQRAVKLRFNSLFLTTVTSMGGMLPMLFTSDSFFINLAIVLITGLGASFLVAVVVFPLMLCLSAVMANENGKKKGSALDIAEP